jgi:hypothetical protein
MTCTSLMIRAALLLAVAAAACETQPRVLSTMSGAGGGCPSAGDPTAPDAGAAPAATAQQTPDAAPGVVPPPPDLCAPFELRFTGAGGNGFDCPTIDCHCNGYVGPVPSPQGKCVQSINCAAACGSSDGDAWLSCAIGACETNADCPSGTGRCIVTPGATMGSCQGLGGGVECVEVADCSGASHCIAVKPDGTRGCVDPSTNDRGPCNRDADCPSERCIYRGTSFLGICSAGSLTALCFANADCKAGLHCRHASGDQPGSCSDGSDGADCDQDADCQVGVCAWGLCSSGKLNDSCEKNADCQSGFCAFGQRCSDGAVDTDCAKDDECASGRCAASNAIAACTSGAPSSKCVEDRNCVSGSCQHPAGMDPTNTFGSCR